MPKLVSLSRAEAEEIIVFLKTKKYPQNLDRGEKKFFQRRSKIFVVKDDNLFVLKNGVPVRFLKFNINDRVFY